MREAIRNFMNTPWTWGTYFKLTGITAGVYCALIGLVLIWEKWKAYKELEEAKKTRAEMKEI